MVCKMYSWVIAAQMVQECSVGKVLYSLTINSADAESDLPFKIKRRQSPLQESFALTINKSQGRTLRKLQFNFLCCFIYCRLMPKQ